MYGVLKNERPFSSFNSFTRIDRAQLRCCLIAPFSGGDNDAIAVNLSTNYFANTVSILHGGMAAASFGYTAIKFASGARSTP